MLYIIFQEFNLQLFADGFRKTWNYCIVHNSKKGFDFRPARRNEKFLCEFEHDLFCSSKRTQNLIVKKSKSYLGQKKTCEIDSMGSFSVKKWSHEKKCQISERSKFILWKVKLVKIDSHWEVVLWNFFVSKFFKKSVGTQIIANPTPRKVFNFGLKNDAHNLINKSCLERNS